MIVIQNGVAPKEIFTIVFRDIPVTTANEEMQMDQLVL
jgi:hypothetical protein